MVEKLKNRDFLVPEQDGVDSLFLTPPLQPNPGNNSTDNSQRTLEAERRRQTGWGPENLKYDSTVNSLGLLSTSLVHPAWAWRVL